MKVLVCIKSLPAVAGRIVLTADERAIDTRYLGFAIGPHEECAVEESIRIVEVGGGEAVVLTLGPAQALEQLREALALGVGRAIHLLTDGSEWDAQSTSAAISSAIRADEETSGRFDLILLGNDAGDTGDYQVAVRVGHALGRPTVTGIKGLTVLPGSVRSEQEVDGGRDVYELPLPAVIGVLEGLNVPRFPSVPGRLRAKSKPVGTHQMDRPPQQLEMVRLAVPTSTAKRTHVLGRGPEAATAVAALLKSHGLV